MRSDLPFRVRSWKVVQVGERAFKAVEVYGEVYALGFFHGFEFLSLLVPGLVHKYCRGLNCAYPTARVVVPADIRGTVRLWQYR
jgi:hypothetical protein